MFYLNLTFQFLIKMAQIWLPFIIGLLILFMLLTRLVGDSRSIKTVIHSIYLNMIGEKNS